MRRIARATGIQKWNCWERWLGEITRLTNV